jgi:hypothetical protein
MEASRPGLENSPLLGRLVHDPLDLHRVLGDRDDPRGDLDCPLVAALDDPVSGEGLLDLGERAVGRCGGAELGLRDGA